MKVPVLKLARKLPARRSVSCLAVLGWLAAVTSPQPAAAEIPDALAYEGRTVWVAVDETVPSETPDWSVFDPSVARQIGDAIQRVVDYRVDRGLEGKDACLTEVIIAHDYVPRLTASDRVLHSRSIHMGRILDSRAGFYQSHAGRLFEVAIQTSYKLDPHDYPGEKLFVFLPVGRFRFAGQLFCGQQEVDVPLPAEGSRIVVFQYSAGDLSAGAILAPRQHDYVLETRESNAASSTRAPTRVLAEADFARLLEDLRRAAAGNGGG